MKIPTPYFKNVLSYGNLNVEEVLLEDVYPVLFILKNAVQQRFICVCCEIRDEQRWILNPISTKDLIAFLCNNLTAREVFENSALQIVAVRNYTTLQESFIDMSRDRVDVRDLPREGVYLDAEENEFDQYIQQLQSFSSKEDTVTRAIWDYKVITFTFDTINTISVMPSFSDSASWRASKKLYKGDVGYAYG